MDEEEGVIGVVVVVVVVEASVTVMATGTKNGHS